MPDHSVDAGATARIERQLSEAGLQVAIEASDGALILSGLVDTEEAKQAAGDIVAQGAPSARIDNQLDVQTVLPTDIDDFAGDEPSAELADDLADIATTGGETEPDFTDQVVLRDPVTASGPNDIEDPVASGDEVYVPPDDPVVTTDSRGQPAVLGGFGEDDSVQVERSAMDGEPGDEALADAVRQELREDA